MIKYHATFMFFYEFCQVDVDFMLHIINIKGIARQKFSIWRHKNIGTIGLFSLLVRENIS